MNRDYTGKSGQLAVMAEFLIGIGKVLGANVMFELVLSRRDVRCGGVSLQRFRDAWGAWPAVLRAA